jgi:hypothetical protein
VTLPPRKTYGKGEMLMGGVSSLEKNIDSIQFSTYFEGYGLYEDADFTLRV